MTRGKPRRRRQRDDDLGNILTHSKARRDRGRDDPSHTPPPTTTTATTTAATTETMAETFPLEAQHSTPVPAKRKRGGGDGEDELASSWNSGGGGGRPPRRRTKHRVGRRQRAARASDVNPSLGALQNKNKVKTRRFYNKTPGDASCPRTVPRTVPPAPENTTSYLMSHNPMAPEDAIFDEGEASAGPKLHSQWTSGYESIGDDVAECPNFEFYGSNMGRLQPVLGHASSLSDRDEATQVLSGVDDGDDALDSVRGFRLIPYGDSDAEDMHDFACDAFHHAHHRHSRGRGGGRGELSRFAESSTAYAVLEEENIDLRERLSLLQSELEETKAALRAASGGGGDADAASR